MSDVARARRARQDGRLPDRPDRERREELMDEIGASKVTGEEDRYSHTDLYDFKANVEGASAVFDSLQPILKVRAPSRRGRHHQRDSPTCRARSPRTGQETAGSLYTTVKPAERRDLSRVGRQAGRAALEDVGHRRAMSRPLSRRRLLELAGVGGVAAVAAGSGAVLFARGGESTGTRHRRHGPVLRRPPGRHPHAPAASSAVRELRRHRQRTSPSCATCSAAGRALPPGSPAATTPGSGAASSHLRTTPAKPVASTRPGSRSRSASGRGCSTAASALPASGPPSWPIFPASRRTSSTPPNPAATSASRPARTTRRSPSTRSAT